jgi:hypothetical protein
MTLVAPTYGGGYYDVKPIYSAAFEIGDKVYFTDPPMLERLNRLRDHGNLTALQIMFAMSLATGRIKASKIILPKS